MILWPGREAGHPSVSIADSTPPYAYDIGWAPKPRYRWSFSKFPAEFSMSESELLYDWRFTAKFFVLVTSPLRPTTSNFIFQLNTCGYSPYVISSLMKGCACRLHLLLVLASAVILRFESRGTHDKLEGQVSVFISPRNRVAQLYPQALGSLFVASYDSQFYGGGTRPRLHTGVNFQWILHQLLRTWRLKTGIVEPEQTSITRQQLGKHIQSVTNTQAKIEELPFLCNCEVNTPLWQ
jgi:hypothetical protein